MTLHAMTDDGYLRWYCLHYDSYGDLISCGEEKTAHIDEVVYLTQDATSPYGASIALPRCACGAQIFLKADYSMKELYKSLIKYEQDGMCAIVLPLRYVYNLQAHWMLYQRGKAAFPPILDMPPQALLEHPSFASVQPSTVYALWFGFAAMKQYAPQALEASTIYFLEEPHVT